MNEYHKIQTVYLRNPDTKFKTLLEGVFATPEFEYLKDNQWIFTEKVDGTNIRIIFRDGAVYLAGKTDAAQLPAPLSNKLVAKFTPDLFRGVFNGDACLYGEGYGAKIQKGGGNYRQEQDFVLFDVKVGEWWLRRDDVEIIAAKLSLDVVPVIGTGTLADMVGMVRVGFESVWGDFPAEGIVARPLIELKARNGNRIITKIKCKDFSHPLEG